MKKAVVLSAVLLLCLTAFANSPIELIKGIGDDASLLEDYTRPLVESYGVAMGTGWYHSAQSLRLLRLEFGARLMVVNIPDDARTFTAEVWACSVTTTGEIDTFRIVIDNAATIFGPRGSSPIPGDHLVAFPPELPGGLSIGMMPFLVPYASVGLPFGFEVSARYVPWPFKGSTVSFLGVGVKNELTSFVRLPVNLAVQGFYQRFDIGSGFSSRTIGGNLHASRSLLLFAPYAGVGFDKSSTDIKYTFQKRYPTGVDEHGEMITETDDITVNANFSPPVNFRGTLGAAFKLGLILVNADYNYNFSTGYHAASLGLSTTFR